jgi:hypothetical protein
MEFPLCSAPVCGALHLMFSRYIVEMNRYGQRVM